MRQNELNREVARATGETVSAIKHLGFLLNEPSSDPQNASSGDLGPQTIDWDEFDLQRSQPFPGRRATLAGSTCWGRRRQSRLFERFLVLADHPH
ncbi:MAG: hypothetical protein HQ582_02325 [Planctomycetes bacterium]|nr:hypothetical protein [Planctomycetota bacterium]